MPRAALRRTYKTIPTTRLRSMKSTNRSSVGSRRCAWRRTMTMCWRKETPLCASQHSKTWMASRSSCLARQMIRLLVSGNYTLWNIWDGMTIANDLFNTGVGISSKAWNGWYGSQPKLSISFSPFSVDLTAIHPLNASIPKCTLRPGGGKHR